MRVLLCAEDEDIGDDQIVVESQGEDREQVLKETAEGERGVPEYNGLELRGCTVVK